MTILIGFETCAACAAVTTVVSRLELLGETDRGGRGECPDCGERATQVGAWYPLGDDWPLVSALVQFDVERHRLRLPPLDGDRLQ